MDRKEFHWSVLTRPVAELLEAENTLMDLHCLSRSNALAGYACRAVEEMIYKRPINRISEAQRQYFLDSMYEQSGTDLTDSEYEILRPDDPVDRRLLFCLALRWDNRHLPYLLADDNVQTEVWGTVLAQSIELSERCFRSVFSRLGLIGEGGDLGNDIKETARSGVEQDLLHGYIVKLSESLDPL